MSGITPSLDVRTRNISNSDEQKSQLQPSSSAETAVVADHSQTVSEYTLSPEDESKDKYLWRDLVAYWFLGLTNNYGYVVMLTAAHDILKEITGEEDDDDDGNYYNTRPCNIISTGAILLADIIPALIVKIVSPFMPFYVHIRISACVLLSAAGFVLVAFAESQWLAIFGVILTSLASGLGEATFLSYSSIYDKNVISTWSSGTGGAGVIGATSYAGLTGLGMSPKHTLLLMLVVPVIEALAFWLLLRHPNKLSSNYNKQKANELNSAQKNTETEIQQSTDTIESTISAEGKTTDLSVASRGDGADIIITSSENDQDQISSDTPLITLREKIQFIPNLLIYIIPLTLVYLFEYFINQGLFELIYFPDIWLDKDAQYRWFQVDYQIGVFISRSSVNLIQFKHVWVMAVLQFLNVIYFLFEVVYFFTPNIWIIFVLILWEGLLGGGAYVNTFYRMSTEVSPARRLFAIGVTTISDSVGIALAGVAAIPSHNALCDLPVPERLKKIF